jgi:uncharacterized membrane protein
MIFTLAASYGAWHYDILKELHDSDLRSAAGIIAQIGATMLGFVLAALSILATIANTRLLRNMQRTGHYRILLQRMFGAFVAFGIVTLAGLLMVFTPKLQPIFSYILLGLIMLAAILLVDVSRKFWIVLHHIHPEPITEQ